MDFGFILIGEIKWLLDSRNENETRETQRLQANRNPSMRFIAISQLIAIAKRTYGIK